MKGREFKDQLYEHLARVGKAMASAKRIELLDLLCQGERSVEELAAQADMSSANTSAHLQVLRLAGLVASRKEGTRVFYRLSDDGVARLHIGLRDLASARLAEIERVARDFLESRDRLEPVTRAELQRRLAEGDVQVIDVRPVEEYRAAHIPGAISVPLEELPSRMGQLPRDREVIAYCRGPYCVLAPQAVSLLRRRGFRARRLEDGLPEWRLAALPTSVGGE